MLRSVAKRAAQTQDVPAWALTQVREYIAPLAVEITEDVATSIKSSRVGPNIVAEWGNTKAATEQTLRLLQTYKELGDSNGEPYLHYHNPKTFEDLDKPIPNFKKFGLKAGEVPKFFDTVLQKRASEAVDLKNLWWDHRKSEAEEAIALHQESGKKFSPLPLPKWTLGQPVTLDNMKQVTDAYFKALEPPRKLQVPQVPAQVTSQLSSLAQSTGQDGKALTDLLEKAISEKAYVTEGGKPVPGFTYVTAADAEAALALRRSQVHSRFLKMWARRIMSTPEQALVPLKERDALLASKFEDVSEKYNDLINLVSRGKETFGERMANTAAFDNWLLCRDKQKVKDMYPASEEEKEAVALASQLEDHSYALDKLLGPMLHPEGSRHRLMSDEARAITEHMYTPDRYMYAEGMKLAKRYEEEEKALADKLTSLYGSADGLLDALRTPRTPLQRIAEHSKEAAAQVANLEALKAEHRGNAYLEYALTKEASFHSDPSNIAFEEVLLPQVIQEKFAIEMADLAELDRKLDEAEEEELWLLTLQQQSRHIAQHLEFDMPQAAYAHMDPLLYKKLDWELTNGMDLLHQEAFQAADCEQGEYVKDQMGLENLSHHLLPLLRYRRQKFRKSLGYYPAELSALPAKHVTAH